MLAAEFLDGRFLPLQPQVSATATPGLWGASVRWSLHSARVTARAMAFVARVPAAHASQGLLATTVRWLHPIVRTTAPATARASMQSARATLDLLVERARLSSVRMRSVVHDMIAEGQTSAVRHTVRYTCMDCKSGRGVEFEAIDAVLCVVRRTHGASHMPRAAERSGVGALWIAGGCTGNCSAHGECLRNGSCLCPPLPDFKWSLGLWGYIHVRSALDGPRG